MVTRFSQMVDSYQDHAYFAKGFPNFCPMIRLKIFVFLICFIYLFHFNVPKRESKNYVSIGSNNEENVQKATNQANKHLMRKSTSSLQIETTHRKLKKLKSWVGALTMSAGSGFRIYATESKAFFVPQLFLADGIGVQR